jgi:8-oxo-dGTP pyrophosphatase MutT (NUDIX family)/predicted nucleotidyltransferase
MIECVTLNGHKRMVERDSLVLRPAVYAIIVHDSRVLLMKMRHSGKYHPPGGGISVGERAEDALKREIREETGLEVEVERLAHFEELFFYYDPSETAYHGLHLYYVCRPKTLTLLDDTQVNDEAAEKPRWVSLQDLEAQQFQTHGDIMLDLCREAATAHQVTAYRGREPCQTFQPLTDHKMTEDRVESILAEITHWAARRGNLCAVALVGSWARGAARDDSDIDLVLLTPDPLWFRQNDGWLDEIDWRSIGSTIARWRDADYGLIWSRHLLLADGTEIEFGFGPLVWASVEPVDAGTFQVIRDGCRILHDPQGMLQTLIIKVERDR